MIGAAYNDESSAIPAEETIPSPARRPAWVYGVGEDRTRFSLANERTALAWMRTALGVVTALALILQG